MKDNIVQFPPPHPLLQTEENIIDIRNKVKRFLIACSKKVGVAVPVESNISSDDEEGKKAISNASGMLAAPESIVAGWPSIEFAVKVAEDTGDMRVTLSVFYVLDDYSVKGARYDVSEEARQEFVGFGDFSLSVGRNGTGAIFIKHEYESPGGDSLLTS